MRFLVLAEFASGEEVLDALRDLVARGHRDLDAHSPFPIEGTREVLRLGKSWIRWVALLVGAGAAATGYLVQWALVAVDWPLNVGGRPPHAYPAFIPIAFESLVLGASLAIFGALLLALRLPNLHHAAFEVEAFRSATSTGFWVSVAADGEDERDRLLRLLGARGATRVAAVEGGA